MTGTYSRIWATHRGMQWISTARPHPGRALPRRRAEPGARESSEMEAALPRRRRRPTPLVVVYRPAFQREAQRSDRCDRPDAHAISGLSSVESRERRRFQTAPLDRSSVSSARTSGSARRLPPRKRDHTKEVSMTGNLAAEGAGVRTFGPFLGGAADSRLSCLLTRASGKTGRCSASPGTRAGEDNSSVNIDKNGGAPLERSRRPSLPSS